MLRLLSTSRSAMAAQQEKLDSISNNIANVNTEGYKRSDVSFRDLVYETLNRNGYPNSEENKLNSNNGTGVRAGDWIRDNSQGNLSETGQTTNFAIDGKGYFQVMLPEKNADGTNKLAYTRNGSFNVDRDGNIVDKNGNKLVIEYNDNLTDEDKMLTSDDFKIDEKGRVIKNNGQTTKEIGKVNLYNVVSQDSLNSIGNNLYVVNVQNVNGVQVPSEKPYVVQDSDIKQGFLELSNVDLAKEMTDMIMAQRSFEINSRAMRTADEMWGMANNLRGR